MIRTLLAWLYPKPVKAKWDITYMKVDPRFKNTEFVVEADDFAIQTLWTKFSTQYNWEQDCKGLMETVGYLNNHPVCVNFRWAKINEHLILFYNPTSQIVDHHMVDEWLKKYCNPGRHTDANNFHQVISYVRDCKAQELLTEAKTHADEGNPDDAAHLLAQCWRDYPYSHDKEIETLNNVIKGMKGHPGAKLPKRN